MKLLLSSAFVLFSTVALFAQDANRIPEYFGNGDWSALGALMEEDVDLVLLDNEDLYSKAEATNLLKSFTTSHPCSGFKIVHEGTSKLDSQYRIGEYNSGGSVYRVTYFLFDTAGKTRIRQLRIESL